MCSTPKEIPDKAEYDHPHSDYTSIIHVQGGDWNYVWEGENDANKANPGATNYIRCPAKETITHVERAWLEVHLRMIVIDATKHDRYDVRGIKCYSGQAEDCICSDGTC